MGDPAHGYGYGYGYGYGRQETVSNAHCCE
jgi:hypothetical protein